MLISAKLSPKLAFSEVYSMSESQHFSGVLPLSLNHNSSLDTTLRYVFGACVKKEVFRCSFQLNLQLKMVELPCQIYTLDSVIFELSVISFYVFYFCIVLIFVNPCLVVTILSCMDRIPIKKVHHFAFFWFLKVDGLSTSFPHLFHFWLWQFWSIHLSAIQFKWNMLWCEYICKKEINYENIHPQLWLKNQLFTVSLFDSFLKRETFLIYDCQKHFHTRI